MKNFNNFNLGTKVGFKTNDKFCVGEVVGVIEGAVLPNVITLIINYYEVLSGKRGKVEVSNLPTDTIDLTLMEDIYAQDTRDQKDAEEEEE